MQACHEERLTEKEELIRWIAQAPMEQLIPVGRVVAALLAGDKAVEAALQQKDYARVGELIGWPDPAGMPANGLVRRCGGNMTQHPEPVTTQNSPVYERKPC